MSESQSVERDSSDAVPWCVRALAVKSVNDERRSIRVVASTPAVDSYDEIVEQSWILDRFVANPVILWAHQSRMLPIGYGADVEIVNGNLEATINFVDEKANPMGPQVFESYKQGSLRAVSVGFMPRDVRYEKRDGRDVFVLANNELMEISCTPIGANPEALAKMRARALAANQSPAAERGIQKDISMDEKEKAALEARAREAETRVAAAEKSVKDATEAREKATGARDKAISIAVDALIEAGRFAKDERDEQIELAAVNLELFQRLAGKRTIRGIELTEAKKLPDAAAPAERSTSADVDGSELEKAIAAEMN